MNAAQWAGAASWLFASVGSPSLPAAVGGDVERRVTIVYVRDYARVPRETLMAAEEIARTIVSRAGVESEWHVGAEPSHGRGARGEPPDGTGQILLEVLGRGQCTALRGSSDVLGLALMLKDGSRASYAAVFLYEAEALAHRSKVPTALVLGHAMAHELGHLLLETKEHSATGLMRARWSWSEMQLAAQGRLLFTPEQCARMHSGVPERPPASSRAALRLEPVDGR